MWKKLLSDSVGVYFCEFHHFFLKQRNAQFTAIEDTQFKETKKVSLIHTWSDKAFHGTVVNRALPSLPGGLFEITLTAP